MRGELMKRIISIILVFVLFISISPKPVSADNGIYVTWYNKFLTSDVLVDNGNVLVPIKILADKFDLPYQWDGDNQVVYFEVGEFEVLKNQKATLHLYFQNNLDVAYTEIGREFPMPAKARIENGTFYVPLRSFCELFKKHVSWDDNTRSINISSMPLIISAGTVSDVDYGGIWALNDFDSDNYKGRKVRPILAVYLDYYDALSFSTFFKNDCRDTLKEVVTDYVVGEIIKGFAKEAGKYIGEAFIKPIIIVTDTFSISEAAHLEARKEYLDSVIAMMDTDDYLRIVLLTNHSKAKSVHNSIKGVSDSRTYISRIDLNVTSNPLTSWIEYDDQVWHGDYSTFKLETMEDVGLKSGIANLYMSHRVPNIPLSITSKHFAIEGITELLPIGLGTVIDVIEAKPQEIEEERTDTITVVVISKEDSDNGDYDDVDDDTHIVEKIEIRYPVEGSSISGSFRLNWDSIRYATEYEVIVDGTDNDYYDKTSNIKNSKLELDLTIGEYRALVSGLNDNNDVGKSEWLSFSVVGKPADEGAINIDSPYSNQEFDGKVVIDWDRYASGHTSKVKVEGIDSDYSETFEFSPDTTKFTLELEEGEYACYIEAFEEDDLKATSKMIKFIVEEEEIVIEPIQVYSPIEYDVYGEKVDIEYEILDDDYSYEIIITNEDYSYEKVKNLDGDDSDVTVILGEDYYEVRVKAYDDEGNLRGKSDLIDFKVEEDREDELIVNRPIEGKEYDNDVYINWTDLGSDYIYDLRFDSESYNGCIVTETVEKNELTIYLKDGEYELIISAKDESGEWIESDEIHFIVD